MARTFVLVNIGIASYVAAEGYQSVSGAIGILDEALSCQKVSAALGTYLMEHFDVSDRRSDTRYADWNTTLAYYENYMSVSASH